jgi:hypothetical protein
MINRKVSTPSNNLTMKPEPRPSIHTRFRTPPIMGRGDRATLEAFEQAVAAIPHLRQNQRLFGEPGYLLRVITSDLPAVPGDLGQPPRHPPRRPTPQLHPRHEECRREPTIASVPESAAPKGDRLVDTWAGQMRKALRDLLLVAFAVDADRCASVLGSLLAHKPDSGTGGCCPRVPSRPTCGLPEGRPLLRPG